MEMSPTWRIEYRIICYRWACCGTYIVLCQQSRAELHVIVEVEGPSSLKLLSEGCDGSCVGQLLHTPHASELLVGVLRCRETWSPTRASRMVLGRSRVLVSVVVVEGRHYWFMKESKRCLS